MNPLAVEFPTIARAAAVEYLAIDSRRQGIQIAFASMFALIALIVLLSAIWFGLNFANRLVAPIRRLIHATDQVASGNFYAQVPVRKAEGDLAHLGETFNKMTSELRRQHDSLTAASDLIDRRRRFTEAVLSGRFGRRDRPRRARRHHDRQPVRRDAPRRRPRDARRRADRRRGAGDRSRCSTSCSARASGLPRSRSSSCATTASARINVRVTSEQARGEEKGFVVTLDDITDLVSAQRTSAWADVARRIAHEIKNPLTPIQLSAERIRRKYGKVITSDREVFDQCTTTIVRQVDDIKRMVDEFSSFARMPKPTIGREDIVETVRHVLVMMRIAHPEIAFVDELPLTPVEADFDRRLMSQAVTNIIKNAAEAIAAVPEEERGEGKIRVAVGREGDDDRDRDHGQRQGLSDRGPPPPARALHDDPRGRHRARPRDRLEDPRGARRRHRASRQSGRTGRARPHVVLGTQTPGSSSRRRFGGGGRTTQGGRMSSDILIVDDEADIRELVSGILEDEGNRTRTAGTSDEALAAIEARRPHLVFLDIWLQGSRLDGLQVLDIVKQQHPDLPVVMISGHGNIETAVSAIKAGAYDFIEKPFKADRLVLVAERALEASRLKREVKDLRARSVQASRIVGHSPAVNQLRQTVERVAPTNARILVTGAPGSGKELLARTLHALSARANAPFVVINAATITPENMEAELFGIEAGEGNARRVGALEEAHGGTLYIDEIADMPRETQNRILRVLVDQNFQRVGGTTRVHVDVRIISSSSRDLGVEIAEGRFREDLFHRLSVVPIRVPALSERREDVPELIDLLHGPDLRRRPACRSGASPRTRWRCCSRTTGPATSASCATTSSG